MILSIASQKGGTGKTSTAISLAAGLARLNRRVLLVDVDSQANSSKVLLRNYTELKKEQTVYQTIVERGEMPIHPTHVANLAIAPSHILLSNTDIELTTAKDHREARLKKELDKISRQYDHVIIDCPRPYRGSPSMRLRRQITFWSSSPPDTLSWIRSCRSARSWWRSRSISTPI